MDLASGALPYNLFKQANEFYEEIATNESVVFSDLNINGGAVATVLELLSQGKVCGITLLPKPRIKSFILRLCWILKIE